MTLDAKQIRINKMSNKQNETPCVSIEMQVLGGFIVKVEPSDRGLVPEAAGCTTLEDVIELIKKLFDGT